MASVRKASGQSVVRGRARAGGGATRTNGTRLLVAVDETDATARVLRYVGSVVRGRGAVEVVLTHLAPGLPPALLETGGAERPDVEERIEADLRRQQQAFIRAAGRKSSRLLETARATLVRAGVARSRVEILGSAPLDAHSAAEALLSLASDANCGTIVVGHRAHGWIRGLGAGHLAEHLVRAAAGRAVWIVD